LLIFLTGFMGAGKTVTGRRLAALLEVPFVDLDERIEAASGRRVREILENDGEPAFRRLEREALEGLRGEAVVATGGGVVVDESNVDWMRRNGRVVWLNVPFEVIAERLGAAARARRPLFGSPAAARALWEQRRPLYARCDLEIEVGQRESAKNVAERIARRVEALTCDT